MESIQHIKGRLGAVKNIGTITKAMEVVSATKMRKAQSLALSSRPYAFAALSALADLLEHAPGDLLDNSTFSKKGTEGETLLVLVASDRGLAGSFNSQVLRTAENLIKKERNKYRIVLVGKKLSSWASRTNLSIEKTFTDFGDYAEPFEIQPLSSLIVDGYKNGKWNRVLVVSTHFKSTLNQFTVTREILPLNVELIRETVREIIPSHGRFAELRERIINTPQKLTDYIFEPDPKSVLESILPHLINMQLFHLILEANASEHSARMVAMKNAHENASDLKDSLLLEFNKARQSAITKEMIEISSAII